MFATLLLPNFSLQAVLRQELELHETPMGLIDGQDSKAVLLELNESALQAGVRCGMTPSQGLARCLSLVMKTRDLRQEELLRTIVLQFASSLTPYVEDTGAGICTVEFTDERRVQEKVTRVIEQLAASGITASAGIALTPDTSLLAAHIARPVLQVGDTKTFLASLPIEALAQT